MDAHRKFEQRAGIPKLAGADIELGNLVEGLDTVSGSTGAVASSLLLREFDGLPRVSKRHAASCGCADCRRRGWAGNGNGAAYPQRGGTVVYDPQDRGRKFLASSGGCAYIDLDHLEVAIPEVLSARDHVAATRGMFRCAQRALAAANARLPDDQRLIALANNSDGLGHSYGGHLSFLVTRRCWSDLLERKLHYLGYLASYQVSSVVFAGQGKVGSENENQAVDFQLSQRADFFETIVGMQTTFRRPLVNSRDEALCGAFGVARRDEDSPARLHCIFYDTNLSQVASFLKVGVMQLVLALLESGEPGPGLVLDDPLEALRSWSRDPTLTTVAPLVGGSTLTAVELQLLFLEELRRFQQRGGFEGIVPDAAEILDLWEDTLRLLEARDLASLAARLDWALKLTLLRQVVADQPSLTWQSPALKHLDHVYSSLDEEEGLFWSYERAGLVQRVVPEERISWLTDNPPENTRAWGRAMLLRRAGAEQVDDVDWDRIRFRCGTGWASHHRDVHLPAPLGLTRGDVGALFEHTDSLDELLDELAGRPS